jgi:hypothetical protein
VGLEAAGELVTGPDLVELGERDVVAPEQEGAVGPRPVPAHEQVDVADVVRLEDDDHLWPERVEQLPHLPSRGLGEPVG